VLIPRQETEELVRKIIDEIATNNNITQNEVNTSGVFYVANKEKNKKYTHKNKSNSPNILDIGTGSGCIAISLAKNIKNSKVYALDISTNALSIAHQNSEINNVTINFINESIFEIQEIENTKFDVIVSNPPYVTENEKYEISANVLDFEPHLALFVENEKPLIFYDRICDFAIKNLNPNGKLYFEINQYFGREMKDLMQQKGLKNVEIIKDLNGNDRIAVGEI
jgi:release factor glutamine methyltransferase